MARTKFRIQLNNEYTYFKTLKEAEKAYKKLFKKYKKKQRAAKKGNVLEYLCLDSVIKRKDRDDELVDMDIKYLDGIKLRELINQE